MAATHQQVDPAAMDYIYGLVVDLADLDFDQACTVQIQMYATFDDDAPDYLFADRPEPTVVLPAAVLAAIDNLERLLRKGSPTLAAYEREVARVRRSHQEDMLIDAIDEQLIVEDMMTAVQADVQAAGSRLEAIRAAIPRILQQLAAVRATPAADDTAGRAEVTATVIYLLQRLDKLEDRKAALMMDMAKLHQACRNYRDEHDDAIARVQAEKAALEAMPELSGHEEDVDLLYNAMQSFKESIDVLLEFIEEC